MYRHQYLTVLLSLLLAWPAWAGAAGLCGFPGREGQGVLSGKINHWFASAEDVRVSSGDKLLPLAPGQELSALVPGDLVLLLQMQGARVDSSDSPRYGDGLESALANGWLGLDAGQFEMLRVEAVADAAVQVRGDGPGGGIRFNYLSSEPRAAGSDGRWRWQLVRVPQYDDARLAGDLSAIPWDGQRGGVIALDVRGELALAGHRVDAAGAGFRGGAPLTLLGALGAADDYRYPAPLIDELRVGFGQHASKGEGVAGTPRWVRSGEELIDTRPQADRRGLSDGYPNGAMGRGAPGNAGGGGNSLSLDNRTHSGGGGGGGGAPGAVGLDAAGEGRGGFGGAGLAADTPRLLAGGGGGAGTRHEGRGADTHGAGGRGGGVVLLRAGTLTGPGTLDVSGADGLAGHTSAAGGGGGGGGSIMVQAAFGDGVGLHWRAGGGEGGAGVAPGGAGGAGRLLAGGGANLPAPAFVHSLALVPARMAGVAPGYQCRPSGMLLSGQVIDDNGAGGASAHDGRRQRDERGLAGWPVRVLSAASGEAVDQAVTSAGGQFALSLPADREGQALTLEMAVPDGWWPVAGQAPDLPLVPFTYRHPGRWQFTGRAEYLQDGIVLAAVREPELVLPAQRSVTPGSTQLFLFRYLPHTAGQVRFHYAGNQALGDGWRHAFFLDQNCDDNSEFVDRERTRWIDFTAGQPVCVRVRVEVPADAREGALDISVSAQTRLAGSLPDVRSPPNLDGRIRVVLNP